MREYQAHWRRDRIIGWTLRFAGIAIWIILVVELYSHPEWIWQSGSSRKFTLYGVEQLAVLGVIPWVAGGVLIEQTRKDRASELRQKDTNK